jgi:hypothetical protein
MFITRAAIVFVAEPERVKSTWPKLLSNAYRSVLRACSSLVGPTGKYRGMPLALYHETLKAEP